MNPKTTHLFALLGSGALAWLLDNYDKILGAMCSAVLIGYTLWHWKREANTKTGPTDPNAS